MTSIMKSSGDRESKQLRIPEWLVKAKATNGIKSIHFWIIMALLVSFAYIYYAVLTNFHDIYLIIFYYPLIYAAIVYRLRGVLIVSLAILGILLPHALLLVHDVYSLFRMILFTLFAFLISSLGATLLNYIERQLEAYHEIVSLNEELNKYIVRLESTHQQLIQAEKLNAIGQLAASVAHEINNPLAGVLVYSKLLLKKLSDGSLEKEEEIESLSKIKAAVDRCSYIIKSLLDFSRQSKPELKQTSMGKIINEVMSFTGHQAEMNRVKVNLEDMSLLPDITADDRQLQQVFVNLVINAIQAMPDGGDLNIRGSVDQDGWLRVSIRDTGCGISSEDMNKLFTPFFTTKEREEGTGLGLAVSYGIVELHGGKIEVESKTGEGSTFTVCLPVKTTV